MPPILARKVHRLGTVSLTCFAPFSGGFLLSATPPTRARRAAWRLRSDASGSRMSTRAGWLAVAYATAGGPNAPPEGVRQVAPPPPGPCSAWKRRDGTLIAY